VCVCVCVRVCVCSTDLMCSPSSSFLTPLTLMSRCFSTRTTDLIFIYLFTDRSQLCRPAPPIPYSCICLMTGVSWVTGLVGDLQVNEYGIGLVGWWETAYVNVWDMTRSFFLFFSFIYVVTRYSRWKHVSWTVDTFLFSKVSKFGVFFICFWGQNII